MPEEITPDFFDETKEDNKNLANLFDKEKWSNLLAKIKESRVTLEQVLEDL